MKFLNRLEYFLFLQKVIGKNNKFKFTNLEKQNLESVKNYFRDTVEKHLRMYLLSVFISLREFTSSITHHFHCEIFPSPSSTLPNVIIEDDETDFPQFVAVDMSDKYERLFDDDEE